MLFADDVVLLSYTVVGLQHQLNMLAKNADCLDLTVNLEKSNIVVFRNGGYLARREKWFYKDYAVKIVNAYKFLGVWLSSLLVSRFPILLVTRQQKQRQVLLKY